MPNFIEPENLLKTKTLTCKTQNANLKNNLILKNQLKGLMQVLANGLRYWRWGGRGLCLGAGKTRSQKNARKCRRIPSVQCTLCWLALCLKTRLVLAIQAA